MLSIFPLEIRSLILLSFSYGLAFVLIRPVFKDKILVKWLVLSLLLHIVASFGSIFFLTFFVACIYLFISKQKASVVLSYYVVMLTALPALVGQSIDNVLGINHLVVVKYPHILSLFILFPMLIKYFKSSGLQSYGVKVAGSRNKLNTIFFLWLGYLLLMTLRAESFTSSLRESFYIFTEVALPYLVFSYLIINREDFLKIAGAIIVSISILTVVTLVEILMSWSFIREHIPSDIILSEFFYRLYTRSGSVRLSSTLGEPLGYGYVLLVWLTSYFFLKESIYLKNKIIFVISISLCLAAMLATDSRATLVLIGAILAIKFYSKKKNKGRARFLVVMFTMLLVLSIGVLPALIEYDQHGTFQYRIELIIQSWKVIQNNILFGSTDYIGHLESLRQGQGIIDIVNTYIGVALNYGLLGLSLFVALFITRIKYLNRIQFDLDDNRDIAFWLLSTLAVTMLYIFTTSSVSVIGYYYWMILGLSTAFIRHCQVNRI